MTNQQREIINKELDRMLTRAESLKSHIANYREKIKPDTKLRDPLHVYQDHLNYCAEQIYSVTKELPQEL